MAGTEMMRIADFKSIEVRVDVPENDIPKIKIGDSAIITVDAYIGKKFKGLVYQIASSQNGAVATTASSTANDVTNYKVFIRILADSYKDIVAGNGRSFPFRPGMTASADIQTQTRTGTLSAPINAVTTRDRNDENKTESNSSKANDNNQEEAPPVSEEEDDRQVVLFVLQPDGAVKKVQVKTGIQDTKYIEILSGLKGNEQVVSEPYNTIYKVLKNGMKVTVVPKEKLFETKP
jgi:HlyD family secretion protein